MARRGYPPEFRKRVIELVEAGDKRSIGTNEAACVVSSGPPTMIGGRRRVWSRVPE